MVEFYAALADRFPLVSIEDGLDENAWTDWRELTERSAIACSSSATTCS